MHVVDVSGTCADVAGRSTCQPGRRFNKSLLRIYDKLGVSNRVELVLDALTHRDKYVTHGRATKRPSTGTGQKHSDTGDLGAALEGTYSTK
jgi:hypothetical protein